MSWRRNEYPYLCILELTNAFYILVEWTYVPRYMRTKRLQEGAKSLVDQMFGISWSFENIQNLNATSLFWQLNYQNEVSSMLRDCVSTKVLLGETILLVFKVYLANTIGPLNFKWMLLIPQVLKMNINPSINYY